MVLLTRLLLPNPSTLKSVVGSSILATRRSSRHLDRTLTTTAALSSSSSSKPATPIHSQHDSSSSDSASSTSSAPPLLRTRLTGERRWLRVRKLREQLREQLRLIKEKTADKMVTVPNALSLARICVVPPLGYLVLEEYHVAAFSLFTVAALTDALDGWIARQYPTQRSSLGSMLDPMADKLLVSTLFVTLSYAGQLPVWLTVLVFSRDALLVAGALVRRYQMLEPPFTLRRFFDPSVTSMRVEPTLLSKLNTALQLLLVTGALASPLFGFQTASLQENPYMAAMCYITATTTLLSGAQYAWSRGGAMVLVKKKRDTLRWKTSWMERKKEVPKGNEAKASSPSEQGSHKKI